VREEHSTFSEEETIGLARTFAQRLERGDVVALRGELGTGKTRFVKGVSAAFGAVDHVSSPSFVILNRYEGRDRERRELYLYHLDLYRVKSIEEIYDIGYEEFVYGDGITLIEWAEQLGELLPQKRYEVCFSYGEKDSQRLISIELVDESAVRRNSGKVGSQR
jgi:tRNA threonylcarbamoyladenosine biosynthesis protein TsaE